MKRICFIYRKHADTPSIERVFRILTNEFEKHGIEVVSTRLRFGNGLAGVLANLAFFRPPKADVYHITGHVHYVALRLPPNKTVLTVHDLGILRNRSGIRLKLIKKLFFHWPFKRLRYLTAISEATKCDMIESTGCDPKKVTVVNDPVDPGMTGRPREFNTSKPAILQIGTAPHKNLKRLIAAVKGLPCWLMIVGKPEANDIEQLRLNEIEFESLTAETDDEMRGIYERCDIVAFCSTFEGFGLPVIEAQSMGAPLITSDLAPMNEVAGEGAVLVDPHDVAQIRRAIEMIIADPNVRNTVVAQGKKNVGRFEASVIAGEYLKLYGRIEAEKGL